MICFCHMTKTAGTTLHHGLRHNFGTNYVEFNRIPQLEHQVRLLRVLKGLRPNLGGIGGHYLRANDEFAKVFPDVTYFTFLRDPVRRFFSWYKGQMQGGKHSHTVQDHCANERWRNYQTKFLLGCITGAEREFAAGAAELEKAKGILRERYAFVGLVERYDESLLLMRDALRIPRFDIRYEQRNVKKSGDALASLSADERACLEEANSLDIALYDYACDVIWPEQVARYPGDLAADLAAFKRDNEGFVFDRFGLLRYRVAKHGFYRPLTAMVQLSKAT